MYKNLLITFFLFLPRYVAPQERAVYEYTPDNFKKQIEDMDGNFIMFYAPWCRHCTEFYPIWSELAELINTKNSKFAIAKVDCTKHFKLCQDNDITGYPTLLYFHKGSFSPVTYKGTRDFFSLTFFLSEVFTSQSEVPEEEKQTDVKIYSGVAYLNDQNIEKFVSKGQHFIMFYAPWCKACQRLAPIWSELGVYYAYNGYVQIGKVNCLYNDISCRTFDIKEYPYLLWIVNGRIMGNANADTLEHLKFYVEHMLLGENYDPEKFMKQVKILPVARITEETFETFMEKDLVYVNYFAPWCAHCMKLSPLWLQLGEIYQNDSRVLIADVDCARSRSICVVEKITGLPTLILYKNKKIVKVMYGSRPLESLIATVKDHLQDSDTESSTTEPTQAKDEL